MIAYDLDGVIVSDVPIEDDIEKYLEKKYSMEPIFIPDGDYYIITGRPSIDKHLTYKWIDKNFYNKPLKIFHDNKFFHSSNIYKVSVINENSDINLYIESSEEEADYIRKNTNIKVVVFKNFIKRGILNESIF